MCHGSEARRHVGPNSIPDLRRASAVTHGQFATVVIGGLRKDRGMPVFADTVSASDLAALQAFILKQARNPGRVRARQPRPISAN